MEVLLNPDGTRNRDYRPYIDQEELSNSLYLYDPNRAPYYGLYDGAQPVCQSWQASTQPIQRYNLVPSQVVDYTGRPHFYRHARQYETLMRR